MLNHGVNFNLGPAKVCSPAIFERYSSSQINQINMDYYNCAVSIDSCTAINKFHSIIIKRPARDTCLSIGGNQAP